MLLRRWINSKSCLVTLLSLFLSLTASAGDWHVHEADMTAFQQKMHNLEGEIHEQIEKKKAASMPEETRKLNEEIATTYRELTKVSEDYRTEKLHMRFKHPEKGDLADRKYPRYKLQTLDELEKDQSFDGRLDRIREKMHMVYMIPDRPTKTDEVEVENENHITHRKPASLVDPNRITLQK